MKAAEVEFIFEPDPDGGYHAYAPELPGLHTEGDTLEQALAKPKRRSVSTYGVCAKKAEPWTWAWCDAHSRCLLERAAPPAL